MTTPSLKIRSTLFREEEPEWLVWALVIALLLVGLLVRTLVVNAATSFSGENLSVRYPLAWNEQAPGAGDELLSVSEPFDAGLLPARFTLQQMPVTDISTSAQTLGDFALKWADRKAKDLLGYKVLNIEAVRVRGKDAVRVDYVFVAEPAMAAPNSVPIVARGADVLLRQDDTMTVASLIAASDDFAGLEGVWNRILGSLELK